MTLFFIRSVKNENLVFDVKDYNRNNGARVVLNNNAKTGNQKFKFENGYFIPFFDETKCISLDTHTNRLILWDRKKDKMLLQKWEFIGGRICSFYNKQYITVNEFMNEILMTCPKRTREASLDQLFDMIPTTAGFFNKLRSTMNEVKNFVGPMTVQSANYLGTKSKKKEIDYFFITSELNERKIISLLHGRHVALLSALDANLTINHKWCIEDGTIKHYEGYVLDINDNGTLRLNNKHSDRKQQKWSVDGKSIRNIASNKVVSVGKDGCSLHLENFDSQNLSQLFEWKIEVEPIDIIDEEKNEEEISGRPEKLTFEEEFTEEDLEKFLIENKME